MHTNILTNIIKNEQTTDNISLNNVFYLIHHIQNIILMYLQNLG